MNNLPEVFTGTAPSKSDIQTQCDAIIASINDEGTVNPLRVATTMTALALAMKTIKAGIEDFILDEAQKYESKSFDFDGHTISVKETGVKYDYSLCCDPVLARLENDLKATTEKLKVRQTFLKSVKDQMTIVDEKSGEVFTVLPPSKSGKTSVAITLSK